MDWGHRILFGVVIAEWMFYEEYELACEVLGEEYFA